MQKYFYLLWIAFVCMACNPTPVSLLTLSETTLQMTVGDMEILEINVDLSDVQWTSSDPAIVTVDKGVVTAVGVGFATVRASIKDDYAECQVYVIGKKGETLSLTPDIVPLKKGDTYQYVFTSTYDVPLTWTSSNPEVATVSETGLVHALKGGNTIITLSNGLEEVSSRVAVEHTWGDYQLVWSDEFDGNTLNTDNWTVEVNGAGGGNKELQYYTDRPENLRVENGCLVIEARKEEYQNREYTSARINSRNKRYFKYGKIEARMMLPAGGGTWPAFWTMGNDYGQAGWPKCGEIDIMEHIGNQPRMVSFALHTQDKNGSRGNNWSSRYYMDGVENQWHTFGIEWKEEGFNGMDQIYFTIDGEEKAMLQEYAEHVDDNYFWPFNKAHFIILNLAIGGNMGGQVDDAIFDNPILMKVDWVRVYQRNEVE
ncbi:MAG: family 16 glycosylhydrolase [Paludibacteraceae bacterium]|nr:family 16 glycosylhydrolase [Paludibacteraceae bacterium]